MTLSQSIIFHFIAECEEQRCTKKELVKAFSKYYFVNAPKHIGNIVMRMVKNGSLIRLKRGHYKINPDQKYLIKAATPTDPNQLSIFDVNN